MFRASVLLLLFFHSVAAQAQDVCPWLTQGTAAALMGGNVSVIVHVAAGEGTCGFLRAADSAHSRAALGNSLHLQIAVSHLPPNECVTGERLAGIGQDSVLCRSGAEGQHHDIIRGRVRATYFLLTLTGRDAGASEEATLRRSLEQVAEEVAGSLF